MSDLVLFGPGRDGRRVGPYWKAEISFGTRHGKERQVAPVFARVLGASVSTPSDLDTDQFGSFSGEIPRRLGSVEAALAKARLALAVTGHRFGLASEASYGPMPGIGLPGHEEILLFLDDVRGWHIIEGHRTLATPALSRAVTDVTALAPDLSGLGFPEQALTVRPDCGPSAVVGPVTKGIIDEAVLAQAITTAAARAPTGRAVVEADLRAHHNPTRRAVIANLAGRLARRLATRCPACASPGFGRTRTEPGRPCSTCGEPTPVTRAEIYTCPGCLYSDAVMRTPDAADPSECPTCNP